MSDANIKVVLRDSGVIEGNFERAHVERIVNLLRSGALPATLKPLPVSENTIGPTLGADTIKSGTMSISGTTLRRYRTTAAGGRGVHLRW